MVRKDNKNIFLARKKKWGKSHRVTETKNNDPQTLIFPTFFCL